MKEKLLRFLASDPLSTAWAKIPTWARRAVVYPAFFLFCFSTFCYWTFPYERVRDFVVQSVELESIPGTDRMRPTRWRLDIVELEPSWVTGIELTGVRVQRTPEDEGDRPLDLAIPEASARVSLISLLLGSPSITFDAQVGGGSTEGSVELSGGALRALELEIADLELRRLGAMATAMGLPIGGRLSAAVDMEFPEDPQQTEGEVHATVTGLTLGDARSKLVLPRMRDGLTVDPIRAGDAQLDLVVAQGEGRVQTLRARGPHLVIEGGGTLHFATPLALTRLDLLVSADFTDAYKSSSPRTQALFTLLEGNPMVRGAQTSDGKLQLRLRGTLGGGVNASPAGRERMPTEG